MSLVLILLSVDKGKNQYIRESIDSIVKQSFTDFHLFVLFKQKQSEKDNLKVSYKDDLRIHFIDKNEYVNVTKYKYVVVLSSGDIMHSERLRIQVKRMSQKSEIDVCCSWGKVSITEAKYPDNSTEIKMGESEIEFPTLSLLRNNFILKSTAIIRQSFLLENNLDIWGYIFCLTEGYKLWFDISKSKGVFFVEPQSLSFIRVCQQPNAKTMQQTILLRTKILNHLLEQHPKSVILKELYSCLNEVEHAELISAETILQLFYNILTKKKNF